MIHQERYIARNPPRPGGRVRILVISPSEPESGEEGPFPLTSSERAFLLPETQVDEVLCKGAPAEISSERAVARVTPLLVEKALWGESAGYDAIVINCMVDPGVPEIREKAGIPVIGAGRAASGVAATLGDIPDRIFPNTVRVNELATRQDDSVREIVDEARKRVRSRGVDAFVLNCAYLGGASTLVQEKVGVPVMPTTEIALRVAETIVLLGVSPMRPEVAANRLPASRRAVLRYKDRVLAAVRHGRLKLGQLLNPR